MALPSSRVGVNRSEVDANGKIKGGGGSSLVTTYGNGTIISDNITEATGNNVKYAKYGNIVKVDFWLKLNNNTTSSYTAYNLANNLPKPKYTQISCIVTEDDTGYNTNYVSVDANGVFKLNNRYSASYGKVITGGFTYICDNE